MKKKKPAAPSPAPAAGPPPWAPPLQPPATKRVPLTNHRRRMVGQNIDRHYSASYALNAFEKVIMGGTEPRQQNLSDLLCNLMHVARAEDLVFQAALDSAENHYAAETAWTCRMCGVKGDPEDDKIDTEHCPACGYEPGDIP